MEDNKYKGDRLLELVTELANDPWAENGIRRVCRMLLARWAEEDSRVSTRIDTTLDVLSG